MLPSKLGLHFLVQEPFVFWGGGEGELTKHLVSKKKIGSTFQGGTNDLFPRPSSYYAELETLEWNSKAAFHPAKYF